MAGVEFVTGAEAQAQTGEPHAAAGPQPDNQQAITCCFAVDYLDGQDHTIDRPAEYAFWRDLRPRAQTPLAGTPARPDLLRPDHAQAGQPRVRPSRRGGRALGLPADPRPPQLPARHLSRQLGDHPGQLAAERLLARPAGRRRGHAPPTPSGTSRGPSSSACRCSTGSRPNAPGPTARPAGRGCGSGPTWSGPRTAWPRPPTSANRGGSQAEFTVVEQHVGTEARREASKTQDVQAEPFPDSVGVGSYRIDLHPSTGGDNYIDISSLPFQIPLGALIPRRVENLLPACKNLGTTHITNGCYRLHPVEWAIGEAAGAGGVCPRAQGIASLGPEYAQTPGRVPIAAGRSGSRDRLAAAHPALARFPERSYREDKSHLSATHPSSMSTRVPRRVSQRHRSEQVGPVRESVGLALLSGTDAAFTVVSWSCSLVEAIFFCFRDVSSAWASTFSRRDQSDQLFLLQK